MPTSDNVLDIEQLKAQHKQLEKRKTTAEADLNNADRQLDAIKTEARAQFGTDDLEQLRAKLNQMKADNLAQRQQYQKHLADIQSRLDQVEKDFAAANTAK